MAVDMGALTADLAAESAELYEVLSVLAEREWNRDTPAAGWTVRDQVTHLAYFSAMRSGNAGPSAVMASMSARNRSGSVAESTAVPSK